MRSLIVRGNGKINVFELKRNITIGRTKDNDIILEHDRISRSQATLEIGEKDQFILFNKSSTIPICVKGEKIKRHVLSNYDVFEIGEYEFTYIDNDLAGKATGLKKESFYTAETVIRSYADFETESKSNVDIKKLLEERNVVTRSQKMFDLYKDAIKCAKHDFAILITGETGTGKELLARFIHDHSERKEDQKYFSINSAEFKSDLFESNFFGHVKGAFTGASNDKDGLIEAAKDGTLFLDEIGDVAIDVQPKLLRFLQDGSFNRLGSNKKQESNARIIAATNRDLESMVKKQSFREDLYFRLNVFPLKIPPLRERKEDIEPLSQYFAEKYAKTKEDKAMKFPSWALDALEQYDWPGNVREIENLVIRLSVNEDSTRITPEFLKRIWKEYQPQKPTQITETLAASEKNRIADALKKYGWKKTRTAEELGIHRSTLLRKIKEYELEP